MVVFRCFLLTASIRHYFPKPRAYNWTATGVTLRESHPSEDLSELPPLLESVAGQGYHCRRTGSWRGLPKPLRFGWVHARFLKGRLFMQKSAQEGLGASARRCPFRGPSAKVIQLPDIQFSKSNREVRINSLSLYNGQKKGKPQPPNQKIFLLFPGVWLRYSVWPDSERHETPHIPQSSWCQVNIFQRYPADRALESW